MTPISALQTEEAFILHPHATVEAYSALAVALISIFLLTYMGWTQIIGKKDWSWPETNRNGTKLKIIPPYQPLYWFLAFAMVFFFFDWGFSGFYGFRIHSNEVELIYVWPKESVSIPRSILLREGVPKAS